MAFTPYNETQLALQESFNKDFLRLKEKVSLMGSYGRILANDIVAKISSPRFPTSSMDGYAIKYSDQKLEKLKITKILPAGSKREQIVESGECIKTFTGSLMSEGSDTLVPIENVEVKGDYIYIKSEVPFGFAVRPVGENYKEGEVLITKGTKIGYCEIGMFAELGIASVEVISAPRLGVIATGSEIVDIGEPLLNDSQIRSSNHVLLANLARHWGAEPILFGIVKDDKEAIRQKIKEALIHCDIVVTTGGVSVGDFDYVRDIINEYGAKPLVNGAAIKPGRHVRILKFGEKYLCSYPGFPYSAAVTFRLYSVPIIRHYLGLSTEIEYSYGMLEEAYKRKTNFSEYVSCNINDNSGTVKIDFDSKKEGSSAILNNLLSGSPLLFVPDTLSGYKKGERVPYLKMIP
ncbi:MAG: molybdopterin molybdotransferase MoeA [Campylobacteraceae bacterium]